MKVIRGWVGKCDSVEERMTWQRQSGYHYAGAPHTVWKRKGRQTDGWGSSWPPHRATIFAVDQHVTKEQERKIREVLGES